MIAMGGNSISPKEKIGTISEQFENRATIATKIEIFIFFMFIK